MISASLHFHSFHFHSFHVISFHFHSFSHLIIFSFYDHKRTLPLSLTLSRPLICLILTFNLLSFQFVSSFVRFVRSSLARSFSLSFSLSLFLVLVRSIIRFDAVSLFCLSVSLSISVSVGQSFFTDSLVHCDRSIVWSFGRLVVRSFVLSFSLSLQTKQLFSFRSDFPFRSFSFPFAVCFRSVSFRYALRVRRGVTRCDATIRHAKPKNNTKKTPKQKERKKPATNFYVARLFFLTLFLSRFLSFLVNCLSLSLPPAAFTSVARC